MSRYRKRRRAQDASAVVGVDAGKRKHALVVRPHDGPDSRPYEFPTDRDGFDAAVRYIREVAPHATPETTIVGIEFAGIYGFTFAYYLAGHGYQVVTVLPAHSKRWKEVVHNQALKTDAKDAMVITDLVAHGNFVAFAFLDPAYADLRSLVSARERLSGERRATITRLKSVLEVVWPEFERRFKNFGNKTPLALLERFPSPQAFLQAPRRSVLGVMRKESRNHLGVQTYEELRAGAERTVALPIAEGAAKDEIPLLIERLRLCNSQIRQVEAWMVRTLDRIDASKSVLSVPEVAPVTAAVFLGSIGDPTTYETKQQVFKVAGLSLVESSSGARVGDVHISKRGRPILRRNAYMLALRLVQQGGMFRKEFDAYVERHGPKKKIPGLVAISRRALALLYSVARDGRTWTPKAPGKNGRRPPVTA
jgi:transposase